ncbi:coiled-coil domain-containing protein [Robertmurraya siralis]|uniref:hypothetical protein n=1 Tax=Robertmurraya siralis TaxID=77777 RepID=UPI0010F6B345|nr:hypothetical protein [Robertmurraya siralis]
MSLDLLNGKIRVYNYETAPVGFPSQNNTNGIFISGKNEEEEFVVERVSFEDIEVENTKSDLFKVGRLRFHPDEEDEVYEKLGIEDKDNIKTDSELMTILKTDDIKTVKWIANLKSPTLLLRLKSLLFKMEQSNQQIPHQILSAVNERNNEIKYGLKRHANSEINRILEADKKKKDEDAVQKQLSALTEKLDRLEKESAKKDEELTQSASAIQDLLKMVNDLKSNNSTESKQESEVKKTTARKNVGRPPKNS